jgi:hypothetical protein
LEALKKEGNVLKEALEKSNQVALACILSRPACVSTFSQDLIQARAECDKMKQGQVTNCV